MVLAVALPAAEVPLSSDLPVTDARWINSYEGRKPPLFNRNFSGNPISVGGIQMQSGICGRTPFSMIYNIRGAAEEFTALVGLEDEDHPLDIALNNGPVPSVMVEIRVDRKTVFCQEMKLGATPASVRVNLREKQQLELRADCGKGNVQRQRIAWGNPIFHCTDSQHLRSVLSEEKKRREAIFTTPKSYPPAPAWNNISIKKVTWQNYHNAYEIRNGALKAVFVPEMGGRIIWLSGRDGHNVLCDRLPQDRNPLPARGRTEDMTGGHFIRLLPQNYFIPSDPVLEQSPYDVAFPADGVIVMRSSTSPIFLVEYIYRFEFQPGSGRLRVVNGILNKAPFPLRLGVWSLTRLPYRHDTRVMIPHPMPTMGDQLKIRNENGAARLLRNYECLGIQTTTQIQRNDSFLELLCPARPMTLRAELNPGKNFTVTYQPDKNTPGVVHIFADRFFVELEGHGEANLLHPESACWFDETWLLEEKQPEECLSP